MTVTPNNERGAHVEKPLSKRRGRRAAMTLTAGLTLPLVLAPAGMQVAAAATPSVVASDDAYTTSTLPERNAGEKDKVAVGLDGNADKVGYFRFELPSGELDEPSLQLTIMGGTAGTLAVHATNTSWTDRGLTADNAPALGKQVGEAAVTGRAQTIEVPLDLDLEPSDTVAVAVTRTDGGITRIASQERAGDSAARLGSGAAERDVRRAPAPEAGSEDSIMPLYVSPTTDADSRFESFEARMEEGWATGLYVYWPGEMKWNSGWADFVARYPEGIPVVGSPKVVNAESVRGFLDKLPQAWRDKWTMAYYQEPEDNFTTAAQRAEFRERVALMADLVRPYGVANAVHLQEWTLSPFNKKSWGGEKALSEFFNPEDVDRLSWSLYRPKVESMRVGVDRIKDFSEKYAPGVPWGVTASGSPVPPSAPVGGAARAERAQTVRDTAQYIAEAGGQSYGWFDHDEYLPGQDLLASKDPALTAALRDAANVRRSAP